MQNNKIVYGKVLSREDAEKIINYEASSTDGLTEESRITAFLRFNPHFNDLRSYSNNTSKTTKYVSIDKTDIKRSFYLVYDKELHIPSCHLIYTNDGVCIPIQVLDPKDDCPPYIVFTV